MRKEKKAKNKGMVGKVIRTTFSGIFCLILVVVMVVVNTTLASNNRIVDMIAGGMTGATYKQIDNSDAKTEGLDLEYNKSDYTKDSIAEEETSLKNQISEEGLVLLKNESNALPISKDQTLSFFSVNSNKLSIGGGLMGGGSSLKDAIEADGMKVNDKLWEFYSKQAEEGFGLASGSISFGDAEDFRINEVPLSALQEDVTLLESVKDTVPVYVLKRVAGEGRDMPRSMYNHADNAEDQAKSYLEPDSTELEVLKYLNDNFSNVVLVVNSNAAIELNWLVDYPNITSVIYAPDGMLALADVLNGTVSPSGALPDMYAVNSTSSPAMQNFGVIPYANQDAINLGNLTYIDYRAGWYIVGAEVIYTGYKYYETRYADIVNGIGKATSSVGARAGDVWNYSDEVSYTFGYGLSYTTFKQTLGDVTINDKDHTATVKVLVENTGNVAGKSIVQLYAQSPYTEYDKQNKVEKAAIQLMGFEKTKELQAGESEEVTVNVDLQYLASYDYTNA
ncbi:MAG: beta-glucosidase, partial [Clostridiales bacterium]|nr:beta-glucosidase [Clostridiales bacterium]